MNNSNNVWKNEEFTIFVDEVIGDFARCEFPDEEMRDVLLSIFPFEVKERERYKMKYDEAGNLVFVSKIEEVLSKSRRKTEVKWMRFRIIS